MTETPPPDVLALIICDQIITDRMTGKQSLIGMYSQIMVPKFPAAHPQLSVFVALTDGHGVANLTLRIVDANEARKPLVEGRGKVKFQNPRAIAYLALQFHGLVFAEPGAYRVQLFSGHALLREARLNLVKVKPRPRGGPPGGKPPNPGSDLDVGEEPNPDLRT